jgi:hypothetical protein
VTLLVYVTFSEYGSAEVGDDGNICGNEMLGPPQVNSTGHSSTGAASEAVASYDPVAPLGSGITSLTAESEPASVDVTDSEVR